MSEKDKDSFFKALTPRNNIVNFSFNSPNLNKPRITFSNFMNSSNKTFSTILNLEENNYQTEQNNNKYSLIVKKINLKESKNNYYSKAMKNIFFNPKHYLQNYYEGKKVIIGKEHHFNIKDSKYQIDFQRQAKKRKTITTSKNTSKKSSMILQRSIRNSKSFSSNKLQEIEKYTSASSSRSYMTKRDLIKSPVSDNELKLIYKEVAEREKSNKNKKLDFFENQSWGLGIIPMLNLQEKILKTKKKRIKLNEELTKKLMNITFKERNNIIMNNKKDLLVLKSKHIDKELTKFSIFNKNLTDMTKSWIYNLRKNDKEEEQKCLIPTQKEYIYYNKDLFTISNKDDIRKKIHKKIKKEINKDKKIIRKNKTEIDLNSFHNLFIQGKNLLDYEIKLNKDLTGKKKKLIHYNFNQKEISSILLAESNPTDTMTTPKAVSNSIGIHNFQ
jgi:hypothetical protein